jgi:nitroreductase
MPNQKITEESYSREYEKNIFDAIYKRRSIRTYLDKEVEHEKIEKLLKAAMAAPSACNIQPWEFVVVTDKGAIQDIKNSIRQYSQYNTPLVIVVCGNPEFIPWKGDTGIIDCCAAIENMLLAATVMGLGSVWIGGFEPELIRELLDIPDKVYPIGVVYFGYPAEHPEPRTQYREEVVHWGKYDPARKHEKAPGSIV